MRWWAPCVIIHSFDFSHNHMLTARAHIFPILLHSKSFPYLHRAAYRRKNIFQLQYCCCCSKSVVFKMEFHVSDCGIPFHHRVASSRTKTGKREGKVRLKCDDGRKNCGFKLWSIFLPLLTASCFVLKILRKKNNVSRFLPSIFHLSREKILFRAKTFFATLIKANSFINKPVMTTIA